MTLETQVLHELAEASDETIEDACRHADPMVLRGLLYQLTGDVEVAKTEVTRRWAGEYWAAQPASDEDVQLLQRKAVEFLKALRGTGHAEISLGPADRLPTSLGLAVGDELADEEIGLWQEEFAHDPYARSLHWRQPPPPDRLENFSVVVIGAGLGGVNAALQLKRAGIPFTVIEKNPDVGGTWYENRYPGCRVDTPSRAYTHIVGVDFPYPNAYCPWRENKKYIDWVVDNFDLRDDIVFNSEVRSLVWDETSSMWVVKVDAPEGERTLRADAVITAVGFLNRPNMPEIEGMGDFAGPSWHTARWPEDIDLKGKRVAVIGTGCTGYQLIPELAREVGELVVFQRTPQWLLPVPGYSSPLPPQVGWLDRNLPYHTNFMRFRAIYGFDSLVEQTTIDPDFSDPHTLSDINKRTRDYSVAFLERKLKDPDLIAKMTPAHPPWSARLVSVDPEDSVLDALVQDHVTLVTDGIRRINTTGIEANDGAQYEVDAIVYATGFRATEYLYPMTITGRGGTTIDEFWRDGGARAHRFCMIPGFPNLWSIYGPNTNGGLNPAGFDELVTVYALQCIERLILEDKKEIEPKIEAYWRFNGLVDEQNADRVWSDPRAHSYYWTEHGRSAVMCPFTGSEVWRFLRHPDFEELDIR